MIEVLRRPRPLTRALRRNGTPLAFYHTRHRRRPSRDESGVSWEVLVRVQRQPHSAFSGDRHRKRGRQIVDYYRRAQESWT